MDKSQRTSLIIAIAIPIALIVVVGLGTWVPSLFLETEYDFVYQHSQDYSYSPTMRYEVQDHHLVLLPSKKNKDAEQPKDFFRYDSSEDKIFPLSLEDVQQLNFISSTTSPDGYEISTNNYRSGGIMTEVLFNRPTRSVRLQKGSARKRLKIGSNNRNLYRFRFVGWVAPEK